MELNDVLKAIRFDPRSPEVIKEQITCLTNAKESIWKTLCAQLAHVETCRRLEADAIERQDPSDAEKFKRARAEGEGFVETNGRNYLIVRSQIEELAQILEHNATGFNPNGHSPER